MKNSIFITGASGFVGKETLKSMFYNTNDDFYILVRSERAEKALREKIKSADPERMNFLYGDITKAYCGLNEEAINSIQENINQTYHMAASTSFSEEKRKEIETTNITGTENVIKLSKRFPKMQNLFYISTAYVCGTDQGVIKEDRLSLDRAFKNPYEESKLKCEELVRKSGFPFTIIRPSIIMGDSKTGDAMSEDRMVYGYLLGLYHAALQSFIEPSINPKEKNFWEYWNNCGNEYKNIDMKFRADGNTTKNLVTLDDVVNTCMAIRKDPLKEGRTYNVVNPFNTTVKEIIDTMQKTLHIQGIEYIPNLSQQDINKDNLPERLAFRQTKPYWPYVHINEPEWSYDNVKNLGIRRVEMNTNLLHFLMESYVNKYLRLND